jgi:hypothetical protein
LSLAGSRALRIAIGTYAGFQSLCALFASAFAGWLWYAFGPAVTFVVTGAVAVGVLGYLLVVMREEG